MRDLGLHRSLAEDASFVGCYVVWRLHYQTFSRIVYAIFFSINQTEKKYYFSEWLIVQPESEGITILQSVGKYKPVDSERHRNLESSIMEVRSLTNQNIKLVLNKRIIFIRHRNR